MHERLPTSPDSSTFSQASGIVTTPKPTSEPPALTIGRVFPDDDIVSRWVFSLSAAVEDLTLAEQPFVETLEAPTDPFTVVRTGFRYRQLIARIYEAERPVRAVETLPDVKAFLDTVADAAEPLAALNLFYLPWSDSEPSPVRRLFGGTRHLTVHHSWPGSDELADALRAARDLEARVIVDQSEERMTYEWAELVALRTMVGDTHSSEASTDLRAKIVVAQDILGHFASLLSAVLPAHCRRLGIDPSHLLR